MKHKKKNRPITSNKIKSVFIKLSTNINLGQDSSWVNFKGGRRKEWNCFCSKIASVQGGNLVFWCLGVRLPQFAHWIMAKENPRPDCNWPSAALCQNRGGERPISIPIQRPAQPSPAKDCLEYRWATFPPQPPGAFQGTRPAAGTPKLPRKDHRATFPRRIGRCSQAQTFSDCSV